jgi:malic enzyme
MLPGLLSAVCAHNAASLTIVVGAACARALAPLTPPDLILPALTEPLLVSAVAIGVALALGEHPPNAGTQAHRRTQPTTITLKDNHRDHHHHCCRTRQGAHHLCCDHWLGQSGGRPDHP